ncbi:hypothetical protein JKF63_06271 [Porcisia hertigi]|uniref:Succinate dehydrogenase assembly factor 3 n=1 Tax=Porcisia hertigi TaxID=2761500 RepID=A0A836IDY3_9TRYP|nr:hypothetical protein JKF63_06271 [Porcisia hertigi]
MHPARWALVRRSASAGRCIGLFAATALRHASSAASNGGRGDDVETVTRSIGYGPFSATAKARLRRESVNRAAGTSNSATTAASATIMNNVDLSTNLYLRLSLAGLPHPTQMQDWLYASPEWRLAFVRLYRTIIRLHNKTVAVSLRMARGQGPEAALSAVTGVHASSKSTAASPNAAADSDLVEDMDDYLLRYLLTPEQQEFGNRFVQSEFARHMDADAVAATTFYASWYEYVLQLASGVTAREMTEKEKRLLSDEQKESLNALRDAFINHRTSKQPTYVP